MKTPPQDPLLLVFIGLVLFFVFCLGGYTGARNVENKVATICGFNIK